MAEAIFAGAVLAIALRWISGSLRKQDSFVLHSSRGAFMRDLNRQLEAESYTARTR
jgi:hypothetical protein